ncbi:putative cell division protein [Octadecabacter antarcticus 307]|uniref:Signal recognition particle receptor FtsY n=2 Tax=Octadecabacter TaxID=53945 RepID=M9R4Q5_9RHOB|nr:putative cell division protein [Octadecabacter antarcticus 307]
MAFFKKLKDRMFKSSSKIEEGLDAIVEDGGVEEDVSASKPIDLAVSDAGQIQVQAQAALDVQAVVVAEEEARDAERKGQAEAAHREAEISEREAGARAGAEHAEQVRIAAEKDARQAAQVEADRKTMQAAQSAADAAEVARLQAERAAHEEAARIVESERQAQEAKRAEAQRQAEAERLKIAARAAQQDRLAADALRAEDSKLENEAREAELARQADVAAAEETERASEQRQAEAARRAEDVRLEVEREAQEKAAKPGLIGRMLGRGEKKTVVRRELDDDMLERLEELLISADMGVDTALRVTSNMAEGRFGKRLSTQEIKELLAAEITRVMEPVARPLPLYPTKPQVVLVVGVNGSGKTTTIGKLASQFQAAGKKVVIAAGDTFRAAAVEQLQVWGDRAGVPVLTAPQGSDPASLAYDAMEQAARDGADLLMIDTAGRLQNRADLMEELQKIVRVIRKKDPDAPHNTLLVLDATTGQNALSQVKTFQELADVTGLIMTKLDGTAKGGVLVALADKFGLPIHAIGVGEQIDDLAPFDPEDFAAALTGLDR